MQREPDRPFGQPLRAVSDRDRVREEPADRPVHVPNADVRGDRRLVLDRRLGDPDQLPIERGLERRILLARSPERGARGNVGCHEQVREVDPAALPVLDRLVGDEQVDAADQILEPGDPELGHDLPGLLGDEEEEVHDVLGRAREPLAQHGVLGGDADRAGVQVAGAHHHAARRDERGGREAHLVGAEQPGDHDVAAGLQLAVGLNPDPRAQVVHHERLLRLGEADLPRDRRRSAPS